MRILIRTSRWAIWSRRLAAFALPVLVFAIFLHRANVLDSNTFAAVFVLGSFVAFLAVATGLIAFMRLWHTGDQGWARAMFGIFLGLICMTPLLIAIVLYFTYPFTNNVATNWNDPSPLVTTAATNAARRADVRQIRQAFPNAITRTYPVATQELFDVARELVALKGWQTSVMREPGSFNRPGQINATESALFGFVDEIGIVVVETQTGAQLDMRSASTTGEHDLGGNGLRVEAFLLELDDRMNEYILAKQATLGTQDSEEPAVVVEGVTG